MTTKIQSSSKGWTSLQEKVDSLVKQYMSTTARKLPGLTVAVTQGGRLLLTAGYGFADIENARPMTPSTRTLIGSVTKATITGPCAFMAATAADAHKTDQKVYGAAGVLGTTYDADNQLGVKRFTPIVAIAIDPQNHIHAWYADRTVSVGTSADLDQRAKPQPYKLPSGKRPVDIRSIAFASDGRAHVWYDDGTRSIGTATDLFAHEYIPPIVDGADNPELTALPPGKAMSHVVGIGIAKSNDHVYVWYEDSTVSSGTTKDFGAYLDPTPFSPGAGKKAYEIRDLEIASNNHVYAWFADGEASSGTSRKLDQYIAPYKYTWPARPAAPAWQSFYENITIQHVLDHKAGFTNSADAEGAMKMFDTDEAHLTYELVHKHSRRTGKLLAAPGTEWHYSNQGFGMLSLVIEKLTGKTYREYASNVYLASLGLSAEVIPHAGTPGPCDALDYDYDAGGGFVAQKRPASTVGLAAGGWRASAQSLAWIMKSLASNYSHEEVNKMGWEEQARGKLDKGGSLTGGRAYVVMYPDGYATTEGVSLSRVHVALAANILGDGSEFTRLAGEIALAVAASGVPWTFDLWQSDQVAKPGRCGQLRAKLRGLATEIGHLQAELKEAVPGAKGALAIEIKKLHVQQDALRKQAAAIDCCDI